MGYCARERVLVTVESAFVPPRNGMFPGNSATAMTGTVTSMMASFVQGTEYVAVEIVNAGMDGMEMLVKSGLAQTILNSHVGEDWILHFLRPLEHINAKEAMYNHH